MSTEKAMSSYGSSASAASQPAISNMAEHLVLFMDGIDRFYEQFPATPRLPCDSKSE